MSVRLHVRISRIPGVTPKNVLKHPLKLGIVTGDFDFQDTATWRDFATVSAGERSQPGGGRKTLGRSQRTLSLEVLTQWGGGLDWEDEGAASGTRIRQELFKVLHHRSPFRFVATMNEPFGASGSELRMNATVRSIGKSLRHGQPDSRYLAVDFVEYRGAHVDRRSHDKSDKLPAKHKVEAGDTLRKLAKHYYKNQGANWKLIKEANGGGKGALKGYGPDEKLDKLIKGKQRSLKIPEPKSTVKMNAPGKGPT